MKTRTLLMGWVLSPWLICAAQAEEPPDDTIVQETLAEMAALDNDPRWIRLGNFQRIGTGVEPEGVVVAQLIEAGAFIKSERLSRGDITVYEVNRQLPGYTNVPDLLEENARSLYHGQYHPLSKVDQHLKVRRLKLGRRTYVYAAEIPPDEIAKLKAGADARELAHLARSQAVGSVVVGALLQKAISEGPFGSLLTGAPNPDLVMMFANNTNLGDTDARNRYCHVLFSESALEGEDRFYGGDDFDPEVELWTSINPMTFMAGQACFLLAGADAIEALGNIPPETAQELISEIERAKQAFRYHGTDTVDGRPTHKIGVDSVGGQLPGGGSPPINGQQSAGDPQMEIKALYRWIDAEYFVPRKLRIEGVMHAEGQSREFFLEKLEQDYRNVPNSHLYEPYRTVLRMGGMLTPSQEAEMRESQGKLDELERRLASMSPAERALTTRMMGDKIEQWRSLANGGAVEFEIITTSIVINPDLSASEPLITQLAEPAPATPTALSPEELRAAQLACLQERAAAAQQAQKKKRGLGRLTSAVTRTAAMLGDSSIARVTGDLFSAGQSADDLVAAARDLGLTEDDAAACQQP